MHSICELMFLIIFQQLVRPLASYLVQSFSQKVMFLSYTQIILYYICHTQVLYPYDLNNYNIWLVVFLCFVIGNTADMIRFIYHKFGTVSFIMCVRDMIGLCI